MRLHLGNDELAFAIRFNRFKDFVVAHMLPHFCCLKTLLSDGSVHAASLICSITCVFAVNHCFVIASLSPHLG